MKIIKTTFMVSNLSVKAGEVLTQEKLVRHILFSAGKSDCTKKEYACLCYYRYLWKRKMLSPSIQENILKSNKFVKERDAEWRKI